MPSFRALLSGITLLGGHFLNRRFDRVRLIALLFGLVLIALVGLFVFAGSSFSYEHFALVKRLFGVQFMLVAILATFSAVLTFRDSHQVPAAPLTKSARVAGITLSTVSALLSVATLLVSGAIFAIPPHEPVPAGAYEYLDLKVHYGGGIQYSDTPIQSVSDAGTFAPPTGRETLRGRITLDGKGVEGLHLWVDLNSKYEVRDLETDSKGIFEIHVPPGTWIVNSVDVFRWDRKPRDRALFLYSGHEPMQDGRWYVNLGDYLNGGLEVMLPLRPNAMAVELELRDRISMTWPPHTKSPNLGAPANIPETTFDNGRIEWRAVPGAVEYEVQLTHYEHTPDSSKSDSLLRRRLTGTSLPFNSLPKRVKSEDAPPDDNEVAVYAFDADGKLVTQSEAPYYHSFRLIGANRLGKETFDSSGGPHPIVVSEEYEANQHLLSLADELLEQKAFEQARRVLDQVTKDAPRGGTLAARGKLAALQGECATALKLLDQAEAEGATCAASEARKLCSVVTK